jgi:arylsulfatase A-like enzyme
MEGACARAVQVGLPSPFVGEKGDLAEGGIRVPILIRWRAAIDGGQVCDRPSITMDWTATMLDAAGVDPDPAYPLDGPSLLPYLVEGARYPDHDLRWRTTNQIAVRRGDYKYLHDRRPRPLLGAFDADMLPNPPDMPGLPRRATTDRPAVSHPD